MPGDIQTVWKGTSARLQQKLNPDTYDRWIAGIVPLELSETICRLGVSNDMFSEWLRNHYQDVIAAALRETAGRDYQIVFVSGHEAPPRTERGAARGRSAAAEPAADEMTDASRYNPRYSFETFVVGENNKFAHAACLAVAESPGQAYNPLFIYGGTGLGKSHLLHAVAQGLLKRKKRARIECLTSEEFTNRYIEAVSTNSLPRFRQNFRNVDLLLIDDVQFFTAGKERTQEEFFHTFNALYNSHRQIVLASDRTPHEIDGLEKRLVSRFESGLITEIQTPDLETRLAILRRKQTMHTVKLGDDVLTFIATRIKSNIRRLEGALVRLVSHASIYPDRAMTVETAEQLLRPILEEEGAVGIISMDRIQKLVAEEYNLRPTDMTGKGRQANVARPRQVAMYLCRRLTDYSSTEIGAAFIRDHATVLHAVKTVEADMEAKPELRAKVATLERKLKGA